MSDPQDPKGFQTARPKDAPAKGPAPDGTRPKVQQAPIASGTGTNAPGAKDTAPPSRHGPKPKLGALTLRPTRKAPASSNVDTPSPADARPPTSSNVDTKQARPAGRGSGSSNVDTSAPSPAKAAVSDSPNVDTQRAGQRSAPSDKSKSTSSAKQVSSTPTPERPRPVLSSLKFPGSSSGKTSNPKAPVDPSKPPGPDPEILKRVKASKKKLEEANKDLDQSDGATPSMRSPSAQARENTTVSKATSSQYLDRGRMLINRASDSKGFRRTTMTSRRPSSLRG